VIVVFELLFSWNKLFFKEMMMMMIMKLILIDREGFTYSSPGEMQDTFVGFALGTVTNTPCLFLYRDFIYVVKCYIYK
jgi:hypothetical protein